MTHKDKIHHLLTKKGLTGFLKFLQEGFDRIDPDGGEIVYLVTCYTGEGTESDLDVKIVPYHKDLIDDFEEFQADRDRYRAEGEDLNEEEARALARMLGLDPVGEDGPSVGGVYPLATERKK